MPEAVQCTVVDGDLRCPVKHVPGVDGGTIERCPKHYNRFRRGAGNKDVVLPTRSERVTIRLDAKLLRWVRSQASAAKLDVTTWVYQTLRRAMEKRR